MQKIVSRRSGSFGARSLTVALIAFAMASAIAFLSFATTQQALAATDGADGGFNAGAIAAQASSKAKATKASAFEYGYGRYVESGTVYTSKCWYGTKKEGNDKITRTKSKYGPEFTVSKIWSAGVGGAGVAAAGGGYGYDCGKGIYITGFKGSQNAKVVVPDKIGGKPVVCVSLANAKIKCLDVSQCNSLKALNIGFGVAVGTDCTIGEIKFGKNPNLLHFNLDRSTVQKKLEVTPKNIRVFRIMFSNPQQGFSFSLPKLRSVALYNITQLQIGADSTLKELNVAGSKNCKLELAKMPQLVSLDVSGCDLTKLNVKKNKKLKTIYATGNNFDKKTTAALKKWQKAKKGRKLTL